MNIITLPQLPWHATGELRLSLPDQWKVTCYPMAGADKPALKQEEIQSALACPIGIPPIRKLARNKKEVVIIFDDMTRVTRAAEIVPFVLEELAAAGIPDKNIRFVCALGSHGAHNRLDFEKKLGAAVLDRFPVYNHNAFSRGTYVGTTGTYKTNVYINEEVMKCDFKIAIGMVAPHPATGFGGGGKIILPGVASQAAIEHNHRMALQDALNHQDNPVIGMGNYDNNPVRMDIEEAATMAGLDVLINCMVNQWGETVSVFAGALLPTFTEAVGKAKEHYLTSGPKDEDIIIANAFAKASEAIAVGLRTAFGAARRKRSSVVLIANAPEGQVAHYLLGTFGRHTGGAMSMKVAVPDNIDRVLVYSEYADVAGRDYIEETEKVIFMSRWGDVLDVLKGAVNGKAAVAVYPAADIQYTQPPVR